MRAKRSQQNLGRAAAPETGSSRSGRLYVVAVPIGNLDDFTVRAIHTLKTVDLIASEDPQATQQLLAHHRIRTTVTSYGPYNLNEKVQVLVQRLRQGDDVALVSDCGSPLIVDPGHLLVAAAHTHHIPVVPVPGPSAVVTALMAIGLPSDSFYFFGELPRIHARIARCLSEAVERDVPTVFFCTITSIADVLRTLSRSAPRCRIMLACDLTRPNERILRGTAWHVCQKLPDLCGQDMTLILSGGKGRGRASATSKRDQSVSSRRIITR